MNSYRIVAVILTAIILTTQSTIAYMNSSSATNYTNTGSSVPSPSGFFPVVYISGTPYQMGYQYGLQAG
ncbi:MAG: hypothetical protein ACP5NY_09505, partial [Thermocladium sp.]